MAQHASEGIDQALSESGIPGAEYAKTAVNGLLEGKSSEEILADLGKQAAGDLFDESGLGDALKDAGIDMDGSDPWQAYVQTVVDN